MQHLLLKLYNPLLFLKYQERKQKRTEQLSQILKYAHIPYQQVNNMHIWQLCHLGMVVPLADAYYQTENPKFVGQDKVVMRKTAIQLKKNFNTLYKNLNTLSPVKMHIFRYLPTFISVDLFSQKSSSV